MVQNKVKQKAVARQNGQAYSSIPPVNKEGNEIAPTQLELVPAAAAGIVAVATLANQVGSPAAPEIEAAETTVITRKEEIAQLPQRSETSGRKHIQQCINLFLVPLRTGEAGAARVTEVTTRADLHALKAKAHEVIDKHLNQDGGRYSLRECSPDKMVEMNWVAAREWANGTNGVLRVRVQELYADFIIRVLKGHFAITKGSGTEWTHQMKVPGTLGLYPASIIEAACIGTNLPMSYKEENFGIGKGEITFLCSPSASDLHAAELRGFWVKLGTFGEFHLSEIEGHVVTAAMWSIPIVCGIRVHKLLIPAAWHARREAAAREAAAVACARGLGQPEERGAEPPARGGLVRMPSAPSTQRPMGPSPPPSPPLPLPPSPSPPLPLLPLPSTPLPLPPPPSQPLPLPPPPSPTPSLKPTSPPPPLPPTSSPPPPPSSSPHLMPAERRSPPIAYSWGTTHADWNALMRALHGNGRRPGVPPAAPAPAVPPGPSAAPSPCPKPEGFRRPGNPSSASMPASTAPFSGVPGPAGARVWYSRSEVFSRWCSSVPEALVRNKAVAEAKAEFDSAETEANAEWDKGRTEREAALLRARAAYDAEWDRAEAEAAAARDSALEELEAEFDRAETEANAAEDRAEEEAEAEVERAEAVEEEWWWDREVEEVVEKVKARAAKAVAEAKAEAEVARDRAQAEAEVVYQRALRRAVAVEAHTTTEAEAALDAAEKAEFKALEVALTAYEAGVARTEKRLATMLGQVEERARAVRAAVDADPSGAPAAEVDTPAVVAVADEAVPSRGLRNGHEKGPQALPTAGQHPCWWPRGCRRRNVLETLRRGARVRWRAASQCVARECGCGGKEWAGGSPRTGCDVRIRGALQAYGEGPGRSRSGPTSIPSRGQR